MPSATTISTIVYAHSRVDRECDAAWLEDVLK